MARGVAKRGADNAALVVLSVLAVILGVVLTFGVALLQTGVAACGPTTQCDVAALQTAGLITPAATLLGVIYILLMIFFFRRRRVWWIPLPAAGAIVAAFAVSAAWTAAALP
ncbi:hypothetical protein [Leifsonia xyli]|uniref:hypothetical protein n=1 Tax=Leifsonia xyli TaxID=1575 RepID=UPI003D67CBEF